MKLGFRAKIYLFFFSLLLVQGLVIFFWVGHVMRESMLKEIKSRGISTGISLSARLVEPMLVMDFLRMKVLVDETAKLGDDIFYAFVLDRRGNPLVHTFRNGFPLEIKTANGVLDNRKGSMQLVDTGERLIYDYAVPVSIDGNRLGTLRLGLFRTRAEKVAYKIMFSAVGILIIEMLIAGIAGTLLLNPMTRRIKKLHTSSEEALRGNLDTRTAPMLKRNCWDIMECDRKECPAHKNYHHRCWYLAGTLCPTCIEGEYAKKIDSCEQCQVYSRCSGDEIQSLAESFDAMILSQKGNLSELRLAENTLNQQKALLQTILDAIPDFISLQDQEGRYISVNRAFCKMLNRNKNDIVGRKNRDLFSESRATLFDREDKQVLDTGTPLIKEYKIASSKGHRWLHVVKIPVSEAKDRAGRLVFSGRDITSLKIVQEQLAQAQKMESVGRLAAGVAHEINTPLGIILGYGQLLLEDVESGGQAYEDVATIVKQTKICSRIVSDLLNFSRSGERIVSEFDINIAISEALDVVRHTFSLNRVAVEHAYGKAPLPVKGDKEKLKQVFINLLNNAFDAIEESGSICVRAGAGKKEEEVEVSITDTGHGIAKENIEKIFDPFYTTKGPDRGTGLGLSVTFGIIKEHNGTIKAHSPPPSLEKGREGTQFIIVLPAISKRKRKS